MRPIIDLYFKYVAFNSELNPATPELKIARALEKTGHVKLFNFKSGLYFKERGYLSMERFNKLIKEGIITVALVMLLVPTVQAESLYETRARLARQQVAIDVMSNYIHQTVTLPRQRKHEYEMRYGKPKYYDSVTPAINLYEDHSRSIHRTRYPNSGY